MINQALRQTIASTAARPFPASSHLLQRLFSAAAGIAEAAVAGVEHFSLAAGISNTEPASSIGTELLTQQFLALESGQGKVADALHRLVQDGNKVKKFELVNCLMELRKKKSYQHCLEIFEWMDRSEYKYTDKNCALRVKIVWEAKGIGEAEKYFESLPVEQKSLSTYAAILHCYCTEKMAYKAAALFKEMKKGNCLSSFVFNYMMMLALNTGEPGKVPGLVEEMKRRGIPLDSYTYKYLMQSYKNVYNIADVERFVEEIEKDGGDCYWSIYSELADMYIRAVYLEKAEMALRKLEAKKQNSNAFIYGSLLHCYCTEKRADKAAALFEEMKKLNYDRTFAFNNMMLLAITIGEPEKVPDLVQEMKRRIVPLDSFTYRLLVQSYMHLNNMEGVEKAILENEKVGEICHWTIYSKAAATYIRAGDLVKAETTLKKLKESSEKLNGSGLLPYHHLISHYARMGNLTAVNRVWDSLKSDSEFRYTRNLSYRVMLLSLLKLDQLDQLQQCFEEWESGCRHLNLRIVTVLLSSYLRQNRSVEAEQLFDDAVMKSGRPFFKGREMLIAHFLGKRQIDSALRHLRAAIDVVVPEIDRWGPDAEKISAFFRYFEEDKDVDGAEEFSELLRRVNRLDSATYLLLLGTYAAAGRTAPKISAERMKQEGIQIMHDHEVLLKKVCPE